MTADRLQKSSVAGVARSSPSRLAANGATAPPAAPTLSPGLIGNVALAGFALDPFAAQHRTNEAVLMNSFASIGGRKVHPTRLLARVAQGARRTDANPLLQSLNLVVSHIYDHGNLVLLDSADGRTPDIRRADEAAARGDEQVRRIKALEKSGLFEFVEPDWIVQASVDPTDSAYLDGTLWGLRNTGASGGTAGVDIGITNAGAFSNAWDITVGSTNVVVAFIDTGIRYTHFDLSANVWQNPVDGTHGINALLGTNDPMDDNGHGTHTAGTVGAVANNSHPHVGVNWLVRLMGCKFLSATGFGATSDAIKCIDFAVAHGAKVVSNSWGGGGFSRALLDSIVNARAQGALFVVAAGNESSDNDVVPSYPSGYNVDNVIAVAAIDRSAHLAGFSNYGRNSVHLGAPGVAIFSTSGGSDGEYQTLSGTSMACPHVSGVAALIAANNPNIGIVEWRQRLLTTTVPMAELAGKTTSGGRVNAYQALTAVPDGILEISVTASNGLPLIGGTTVAIYVSVSDLVPVANATVTSSGDANLTFLNDGLGPDLAANDHIYTAFLAVPTHTNSISLAIAVSAPGKTNSTNTISFPVQMPPANDYFADRLEIIGTDTTVQNSNVGASKEAGEPNHAGVSGGTSIWWKWIAPTNGSFTIDTIGSSFDTVLAIYTGTAVGSLTPVVSDDDSGGNLSSTVTFNVVAGTEYQIAVDGYAGATGLAFVNLAPTADSAPFIMVHPANKTAALGQAAAFSVAATGSLPLSYRWFFNNLEIGGATNASFVINTVTTNNIGTYSVVVSNSLGTATSSNATLSVLSAGTGFFDDFEPDIHQTNWSSFGGIVRAAKYGGSVSGVNSLWFAGDGSRFAATRPLNTSFGGVISFNIRFSDGASYPWENLDLPLDAIVFEYSIDGGSNWVNQITYDTTAYRSWTYQQTGIPPGAQTTNTMFRWRQLRNDGNNFDHWALDDVAFLIPTAATPPNIISQPTNQSASLGDSVIFYVVVNGTAPLSFQWRQNGTDLPGATNSSLKLFNLTNGQFGTYSVRVTNLLGSVLSSNASLALIPSMGEALNIPWLTWRSGGDAPWLVQTNVTYDGVAGQSGVIFDNQESWVEASVTGPGTVTFWWKVSSEECVPPDNGGLPCDTLNFILYTSNVFSPTTLAFIQGTNRDWEQRTFGIPVGEQRLRWSYKKDPFQSVGLDRAWLDFVTWTPTGVPPPFTFSSPGRQSNGNFQFNFNGQLGRSYSIDASTNLLNWSLLTNVYYTNSALLFIDTANTNFPKRFYRARSSSP